MQTHSFHPHILRKYDIRGTIGDTLSEKDAYYIGLSYASMMLEEKINGDVAIGYDGRLSSVMLCEALTKGLNECGINVVNIGLCATPVLYFATATLEKIAGGIMITGSHNPANQNGFKMIMNGAPLFDSGILKLAEIARSGRFLAHKTSIKGEVHKRDVSNAYIRTLLNIHPNIGNLKVAWDPGNGAVGAQLPTLLNLLPGTHHAINMDVDGTFPNHHPNPSEPKNLKQLIDTVIKTKSDLGIAFDGDGDRLGVVDKHGNIIPGDALLLIMSQDLLSKHHGAKIIADVKTGDWIFKEIEKMGGKPIIWKTGHSFIKTKMKEEGAMLAGEMSGHLFFAEDYYGFDDAIMGAVKLLSIFSHDKEIFDRILLALNKIHSTPEISIASPESEKFVIIENLKKLLTNRGINFLNIDGVRVKMESGWWLLRASNTEAKLIFRIESDSEKNLSKEFLKIKGLLIECGMPKESVSSIEISKS